MPKYSFKCNNCQFKLIKIMNISSFIRSRNEKMICDKCRQGSLIQQIGEIKVAVDRSAQEILDEIKDEVRQTVEKVYRGDERAILDVYGEKINSHKNFGSDSEGEGDY